MGYGSEDNTTNCYYLSYIKQAGSKTMWVLNCAPLVDILYVVLNGVHYCLVPCIKSFLDINASAECKIANCAHIL